MPLFGQAHPAVGKQLGSCDAGASAQCAAETHMLIAHIQAAFSIADRHQGAEADGTSVVSGPDSRTALAIAEDRIAISVAVRGVGARYKQPLVQIDRRGHGVRGWLFRL